MRLSKGLINLSIDRAKLVIFFTLVITAIFVYGIVNKFAIDTNFGHLVPTYGHDKYISNGSGLVKSKNIDKIIRDKNVLIPEARTPNNPVVIDESAYQGDLPKLATTGGFYLVVSSTNLFRSDFLTDLEKVINILESQRELTNSYSIFDYLSLVKNGSRLKIETTDPHVKGEPWTQEQADEFKDNVINDTMVKNVLVSKDSTSFLFTFYCSDATTERISEIKKIAEPLEAYGVKLSYTGGMIMNERLLSYLTTDTLLLVLLCFWVVIVVFYLTFKSKRAVLIPITLSIIGLVWTIGSMSYLGFALNIVSIIIPSLVLVLGSSYSIHLLNEYYVQIKNSKTSKEASKNTLDKITKIVLLACLTTVVNFLSLLFTDLPAFTEFSIVAALGVGYCAILSLTYLPAALSLSKMPRRADILNKKNRFNRVIELSSDKIIKNNKIVLIIVILVIVSYILVFGKVSVDSNYMNYLPQDEPLVKDTKFLSQEIGGVEPYWITLYSPDGEENYFNRPEVLEKLFNFENALLKNCNDITQITSYPSYLKYALHTMGKDNEKPTKGLVMVMDRMKTIVDKSISNSDISNLLNAKGDSIKLAIQHYDSIINNASTITSSKRIEETFIKYLNLLPKGVKMTYGGTPSVFVKLSDSIINGQNKALVLSLIFVLLLGVIMFKSISLGFASIIPVSVAVMVNYLLMYISGLSLDMITISISSITIGVGIDDSIHFLLRYRKNKKLSDDINTMVKETLIETARPIIVTSISIVAGMIMLIFSNFLPIRYFGLLISFALVSTTIGALVVLPSIIIFYNKILRVIRK